MDPENFDHNKKKENILKSGETPGIILETTEKNAGKTEIAGGKTEEEMEKSPLYQEIIDKVKEIMPSKDTVIKAMLIVSLVFPELSNAVGVFEKEDFKDKKEETKSSQEFITETADSLLLDELEKSKQIKPNYSEETQKQVVSEIFMRGESHGKTKVDTIIDFENQKHPPTEVIAPEDSKIPASAEEIKNFIKKLPIVIGANIKKISCQNEKISMRDDYGVEGNEAAHADYGKREIVISGGSIELSKDAVLKNLLHEGGHLSFENNILLSDEDKLRLIQNIKNRVVSSNRFVSNYVEEIKNEDKKKELLNKTVEYFPEIIQAYYSGDISLPKEDAEILKEFGFVTEDAENYEKMRQKAADIKTYYLDYAGEGGEAEKQIRKLKDLGGDTESLTLSAQKMNEVFEKSKKIFTKKRPGYEDEIEKIGTEELPKSIENFKKEIGNAIEKAEKEPKKEIFEVKIDEINKYAGWFEKMDKDTKKELFESREMSDLLKKIEDISNEYGADRRFGEDKESDLRFIITLIDSEETKETKKKIINSISDNFSKVVKVFDGLPKG